MLGENRFRPLLGFVMALFCAGQTTHALAGIALPPPTPPPSVDEEYPDSCLEGNRYFTTDNGPLEIYDPDTDTYPSLAGLNEDGECSQVSSGSSIIGEDITRLMMTEYFNRMSSTLQNRIRNGFFGGGSGVAAREQSNQLSGRAAGDGFAGWGGWSPWVSYGRATADNDLSSTQFDANQDNVLFGADYSYSDRLIFGLSGGYEKNDVDTAFNLGEMEVQGFTIAPYVAYLLTDNLSIDAAVGYSDLDIDQFRTEPGGAMIHGDTDSSRWFVMSNLNTFQRYGDWILSGRVGLIYSEEDQDSFTETGGVTAQSVGSRDIEFGQLNVGGEVAYSVHAIEPFASLFYQYDFEDGDSVSLNSNQAQRSNDDDDFRVAAGFRYFGNDGLSAALEWSHVFDRENYDSNTINLLGRLQF